MYNLQNILLQLNNPNSELFKVKKKTISIFYWKILAKKQSEDPLFDMWLNEISFIYGDVNRSLTQNKKINPVALSATFGIPYDEQFDMSILLMSIQTFYSVLIKYLAYNLIHSVKSLEPIETYSKVFLEEILNGVRFRQFGILNYCYEDWYFWIIKYWDYDIDVCCSNIFDALECDNTIISVNTFIHLYRNDFLKNIYETIIPKQIRHALGEFYTPDWLATCTINNAIKASGAKVSKTRFLDPTCGSGTFLLKVMKLISMESPDERISHESVLGYDINSLAVLTAKTNYLIAIIDNISNMDEVHIPIYHYDTINIPQFVDGFLMVDTNCDIELKLPMSLYKKIVRKGKAISADSFLCLLNEYEDISMETKSIKTDFVYLDTVNASILANIVLNRIFAFNEQKADIIVGNPPWVNWEYLPLKYKRKSQHLWSEYGLFSATGRDLSFSKEDISILITYLAIDRFLNDNGYLTFVLRQAMFKSSQNGVGFRKFRIKDNGYDICVVRVDDLCEINPFDGTNSRSALVLIKKNEKHTFPVPYYYWSKRNHFLKTTRDPVSTVDNILTFINITEKIAIPAIKNDPTSMWITVKSNTASVIELLLGQNTYKARTGVFSGGSNAIYWLDICSNNDDGTVTINNIVKRAKRKVDTVSSKIETTYIFPLVQGSDLSKWNVKYKSYILCPHTTETKMWPVSEKNLREVTPKTYEYLLSFKEDLDARKGFAGWEKEIQRQSFYAILRIGEYTFSKYKVAWRYIAKSFISAVISSFDDEYLGRKLLIPNEKIMYVSTDDEDEAYYLCGILSSSPIGYCVKSYMNPTSISTHVIEKLNIPSFDKNNNCHKEISIICKKGHQVQNIAEMIVLQRELDIIVSNLYGLSQEQLMSIWEGLEF